MYNRRLTVTSAQLNTGNIITFSNGDIRMDKGIPDARGRIRPKIWFPKEIQIINDTGAEVQINFIHDVAEKKDYDVNPSDHELVRLPYNFVMEEDIHMPRFEYLLVKGTIGTAHNKDLIIELLNYS